MFLWKWCLMCFKGSFRRAQIVHILPRTKIEMSSSTFPVQEGCEVWGKSNCTRPASVHLQLFHFTWISLSDCPEQNLWDLSKIGNLNMKDIWVFSLIYIFFFCILIGLICHDLCPNDIGKATLSRVNGTLKQIEKFLAKNKLTHQAE